MRKQKDLSGERFGSLTVLEKTEELRNGYYLWHCRCDCGNEVIVNTKNLTSHRTTHCGCMLSRSRQVPKDRTGEKYGALTAYKMAGKSDTGAYLWECECECGNRITVPVKLLKRGAADCGCGMGKKPKYKDLTGKRKGLLTALCPTDKRDAKGSVIWLCRCDCGNEKEISESNFVFGSSVSCGCVKKQRAEEFLPAEKLTLVEGTCVEWIANRKNRADNTSGFRGIYKYGNVYRVMIGLQGKLYDLGRYEDFDEAVGVRLEAEKFLHDGFITCYEKWKKKAEEDEMWAARNPFYFKVNKDQRTFRIKSTVTEEREYRY